MIRRFLSTLNRAPIQVTDTAWKKVGNILDKRSDHLFYFSATSGGCNGFNYDLSLMEMNDYFNMTERLKIFTLLENDNSKIFIDPDAEFLLFGTTIDYIEEDWNKGIFENKFIFIPDKNLVSACGCGVSFTPKN